MFYTAFQAAEHCYHSNAAHTEDDHGIRWLRRTFFHCNRTDCQWLHQRTFQCGYVVRKRVHHTHRERQITLHCAIRRRCGDKIAVCAEIIAARQAVMALSAGNRRFYTDAVPNADALAVFADFQYSTRAFMAKNVWERRFGEVSDFTF